MAEYPGGGVVGGAEVTMSVLAERLADEGVEVHYMSLRRAETTSQSIRFHRTGWLSRAIHSGHSRRAIAKLGDIAEKSGRETSSVLSSYLDRIVSREYESALSDVGADVYIQECAGRQTAYVATFCRKKGKPFIFRSTSLWDADLTFTWGWRSWRDSTKKLYVQGVKQADIVAANSTDTASAFTRHIDEDRVWFIPDGFRILPCPDLSREDGYVLWVGRDRPYKRPWLYAELARMLPQHQFVMVGDIHTIRDVPRNLRLLGPMKPSALQEVYSKAKILVSTSEVEGFPNVLVEAGMQGVPYLGFLDPDRVVTEYSLGCHVKEVKEMASMIAVLMEREELRLTLGRNARRFVEKHRDIEKVIKKWLVLFERLTAKNSDVSLS